METTTATAADALSLVGDAVSAFGDERIYALGCLRISHCRRCCLWPTSRSRLVGHFGIWSDCGPYRHRRLGDRRQARSKKDETCRIKNLSAQLTSNALITQNYTILDSGR